MREAFICDAIRTPIGRYGGVLATVRADDLAALSMRALVERNATMDLGQIDDVIYGCANQAGEDNRNVARMASLLAGLPKEVPGVTVNRLCGSSMEAVAQAARAIKAGEAELIIAGGVESMSRAPFVMAKATAAFSRSAEIYDSTIGWRFINPLMKQQYGVDSMPETGENVAEQFGVSREDQDRFALLSQQKAVAAQQNGFFAEEIVPVAAPAGKKGTVIIERDEHPRADTTLEGLAKLPTPFRKTNGTVTAGNSSGVNDGACALILASEQAAKRNGLRPRARVIGATAAGVEPRIMGIGPLYATRKLMRLTGVTLNQPDVIELNEAFAAQSLAVLRELGIAEDDPRVNPNGGAIALGHPLGMSGGRLVLTAVHQLERINGRIALCTMCIGVGQGIAMLLEKV
jgi:acetyl-CoA acyltransferase